MRVPAVAMCVVLVAGCAGAATGPDAAGCTITVSADADSVSAAVAGAGPGDTVCLSGTFEERLRVTEGGEPGRLLTIRSLDPATPAVFSPTGPVPAGDQGVVEIVDTGHVEIRDLEITGWRSAALGHAPAGILVTTSGTATATGITLADNHVHDLGHDHDDIFSDAELAGCDGNEAACAAAAAFEIQAFGIAVKARSAVPLTNLTIRGNHLHDLSLGGSEAMAINGNVDGFEVTDNLVHDINNIAIDAIGYEDLDAYPAGTPIEDTVARDGLVARNRVWNVSSDGNPAYGRYEDAGPATGFDASAVGIYLDGARDTVIEANVVVRADIGIEVAAEFDFGTTRDNTVRSNLIGETGFAGIAVGGYAETTAEADVPVDEAYNGGGDATGVQILHNTIAAGPDGAAVVVQHRVLDSVLAGNLLLAGDGAHIERVVDDGDGLQESLNLLAAPDGLVDGAELVNATAPLSSEDLLAGGPALRRWLHLAAGSPAIDAADHSTVFDLGTIDVDGDPRRNGAAPDVGADELAADRRQVSRPNRFARAA